MGTGLVLAEALSIVSAPPQREIAHEPPCPKVRLANQSEVWAPHRFSFSAGGQQPTQRIHNFDSEVEKPNFVSLIARSPSLTQQHFLSVEPLRQDGCWQVRCLPENRFYHELHDLATQTGVHWKTES